MAAIGLLLIAPTEYASGRPRPIEKRIMYGTVISVLISACIYGIYILSGYIVVGTLVVFPPVFLYVINYVSKNYLN